MVLTELLDSVGINKTQLAKLLKVSRQTIQRMGEDVSPDVLAVIDEYRLSINAAESIPVPAIKETPLVPLAKQIRHAKDMSEDEIRAIWKRRSSESDQAIGASLGLSCFHFRHQYIPGYQVTGLDHGYSSYS